MPVAPWKASILSGMVLAAIGWTGPVLARGAGATPPAGLAPATAPGGTEGLAGPRNAAEAVRSGQAIAVPPGAGGLRVRRPQAEPYRRER
ncbi:hypothetical protein [uncultured Methylobacterium sp.]|uniref:hypothetical protein n=1 Tax=uncultured Methylobacterium sp. TaxID=157278 RepID=UPI0035C9E3AF